MRIPIQLKAVLFSLVVLTAASGTLVAVPIFGSFGTTSGGVMSYTTGGTIHKIDYCPPEPSSPAIGTGSCSLGGPTPGLGLLSVQGGTGTFSSIVAPVPGTILDMVDVSGNAPFTYFPVGVPGQTINNFLTVSTFPTFNFQANEFVFQTCAPSATTLCLGGFVLTQVASNVTVSFTVNGTVFAPGFDPTPFTDIISGQFNSTTKEDVAAAAQTPGGIFSNTWSGSVTMNPVPEPGTVSLLAMGIFLMAIGWRRKQRSSVN